MVFDTSITDDRISVIIDGFPSDYWRICLEERPSIPIPVRQVQIDDVLGKMGAFYTKFGYKDMDVDLTFNFLEEVTDFKAWKEQFPHVRKWLTDGKVLEFSDELSNYYLIQNVTFSKDVINDIVEYGEFTVTVTLAPFARVHEDVPINILENFINPNPVWTTGSVAIFNASVEQSKPIFYIRSNTGAFNLTVKDIAKNKKVIFQANHQTTNTYTYIIDSERKLFYYVDAFGKINNISAYTAIDGFPELAPEENTVDVTTIDRTKIIYSCEVYRNMLR